MEKVFVITNIPTPYRIPLFNELNRQLEEKGIKLKVLFGALGYRRRKWEIDMSECNFEYEVLSSKKIPYHDPEKASFTYSDLHRVIQKENPSVIISNGFSIATTKLWLRSWFQSTPYIIWSEAISRRNESVSLLRRIHRKILSRKAFGFIACGTKAKEYLISLGSDEKKITIGMSTVDTEFFRKEAEKIRSDLKTSVSKRHLLYIGHLTKGKRIDQLFETIKVLSGKRKDFVLELVGDGAESENLKTLAEQLNIEEFVRFEGFRQKADLPKYLSIADCFVFPSEYDVWGLVLVEAMAAGLPCIASIHAGATYDLIQEGVTGFAMDFSEVEKVAEKINWILDNPEKSKEIGRSASGFIAENVSLQKSAKGFLRAIERILEKPT